MMTTLFDTHKAVLRLVSSGFSEKQAAEMVSIQAENISAIAEQSLATKDDINLVRGDIGRLEGDIKLLKWMIGVVVIVEVIPVIKTLFSL